ncbi:tyrosine-type recombinase/integrase [Leucobacter chinensis]|uniref:tyrosine-type recombinase/integrase n=1 Tax=Leucobacter chinensis TaxID=2851010 RepID=UPI001C23D60E|nr:tyrosine-type recombinase/integrase [Leucobacter chinensis]
MTAASRSPKTIKKRLYDLDRLARVVPLTEATRDDLERLLATNSHLSDETRRGVLASWRVFYDWAQETGRIPHNPTTGMATVRVPYKYPRIAQDDDVLAALRSAPLEVQAMILLARYACLRLTELTELPQSARQNDFIRVVGKGNKERLVALHPKLQRALVRLEEIRPGVYYFPGRFTGAMHPMSVNKIITRHTGWNPHSLRHAGATAAYRSTRDLRSVQAMLGHSSLATTQRYLHIDESGLRAAALGTEMQTTKFSFAA